MSQSLWLRGLAVPRPRWLVWLPVRCLWGRWHVWWHSWVVTAACTSTCLWEFSRSRLLEVSMSLWIRLCNHTYIHTYIVCGKARPLLLSPCNTRALQLKHRQMCNRCLPGCQPGYMMTSTPAMLYHHWHCNTCAAHSKCPSGTPDPPPCRSAPRTTSAALRSTQIPCTHSLDSLPPCPCTRTSPASSTRKMAA